MGEVYFNELNRRDIDISEKARIQRLEKLEESMIDNMRRLNDMMKELKGLISMVRANAAKNDWYKTELEAKTSHINLQIESK